MCIISVGETCEIKQIFILPMLLQETIIALLAVFCYWE